MAAAEHPFVDIPNSHAFKRQVLEADLPVVVDFWAAWCQPCSSMAPGFERLAHKFADRVRFVKIDTDRHKQIAQQCGIRSLPTVVLYWDGKVKDVLVGFKTEAQLGKRVQWLLDVSEGKGFFSRLLSREKPKEESESSV